MDSLLPTEADPITAARNYAKACELVTRAKSEMLRGAVCQRRSLCLSGLAEVAGIDRSTLYKWMREVEDEMVLKEIGVAS